MEAAQILDRVVARFIGTKHERDVKKLQPLIASINAREAEMKALSDEDLKLRFAELKAQVHERLKDADPAEPTFRELMQQALEPAIVPSLASVLQRAEATREARGARGRAFVAMALAAACMMAAATRLPRTEIRAGAAESIAIRPPNPEAGTHRPKSGCAEGWAFGSGKPPRRSPL